MRSICFCSYYYFVIINLSASHHQEIAQSVTCKDRSTYFNPVDFARQRKVPWGHTPGNQIAGMFFQQQDKNIQKRSHRLAAKDSNKLEHVYTSTIYTIASKELGFKRHVALLSILLGSSSLLFIPFSFSKRVPNPCIPNPIDTLFVSF